MQVYINDLNKKVELDKLKSIGYGTDGILYKNDDYVIKICQSRYMTNTKFNDFISAKKESYRKGSDPSSSKIIFPDYEVDEVPVKNLLIKKIIGYTEKYHLEKNNGIRYLKTDRFINGILQLRDDIHTFFTGNSIAIMDTNPKNILVSKSDNVYFIDHDRSITKNTIENMNSILNKDFYYHNETKFAHLVNHALMLQSFYHVEYNDETVRAILRYRQEQELKNPSLKSILYDLKEYDTVEEYATDKAKALKLR